MLHCCKQGILQECVPSYQPIHTIFYLKNTKIYKFSLEKNRKYVVKLFGICVQANLQKSTYS